MSRVVFSGVLLVLGAWFTTLGACGRTLPGLEDEYGSGAYGDDTGTTGGTDGARGGSNARGGAGGTLSTGGSVNTGGSSRGGTTSSSGGSVAFGGGSGSGSTVGGRQGRGGRGGTGSGGVFTGGTAGDVAIGGEGNSSATGGSTMAGSGGSGQAGTGALPPNSIVCGDGVVCDSTASICCNRRSQESYCTDIGGQCPGVTLECSGRSACREGEVCCFHNRRSVCAATCDVSVGSPGDPPTIILCESSADCADNQTCVVAPRGIPYCGDNL